MKCVKSLYQQSLPTTIGLVFPKICKVTFLIYGLWEDNLSVLKSY